MNIIINGSNGRMGKEVVRLLLEGYRESHLAAAVDINVPATASYPTYTSLDDTAVDADCIIDFTSPAATKDLIGFAVSRNIPLVIASTGHTETEKQFIKKAAENIPVFMAANMSLGVALLIELAKKTAEAMPEADIEIVETHHNRKVDAPSGTALAIADALKLVRQKAAFVFGRSGQAKREKDEIGIHAVRMGNVVGIHEVIIGTDTQTITLKHEAHDRALFAEGAIVAADFIKDKKPGLYGMNDILKND